MVGLNRLVFRLFMALFILAGMTLLTHTITNVTRAAMRQAIQPADDNLIPFYLPLVQRSVCATITADTTWTVTASPYRVTCDVLVPAGVTLTVEAGVTVQFEHSDDDLLIAGKLQAAGTENDPIRFQPMSGATTRQLGEGSLYDRQLRGAGSCHPGVRRKQ